MPPERNERRRHFGQIGLSVDIGRDVKPPVTAAVSCRDDWRRDVVTATVVVLFTVAMHWFAEDSRFGVHPKDLEYRILQGALWSSAPREQDARNDTWLPPIVIDSSQMRRDKTQPTDRDLLDALVTRLDELGAPAIGIDVDFSPTVSGDYLTTQDAKLLAKWNETKKVRVGVYRRQVYPAERWLGYPQFRGMAAGMMLPRDMPDFAYLSISTHPGEYLFEFRPHCSDTPWVRRHCGMSWTTDPCNGF